MSKWIGNTEFEAERIAMLDRIERSIGGEQLVDHNKRHRRWRFSKVSPRVTFVIGLNGGEEAKIEVHIKSTLKDREHQLNWNKKILAALRSPEVVQAIQKQCPELRDDADSWEIGPGLSGGKMRLRFSEWQDRSDTSRLEKRIAECFCALIPIVEPVLRRTLGAAAT
jgi:hypothetical protein